MQLLKRHLWPFLISLLLVLAGCAALRQAVLGKPLRFSHEKMLHQSLECADCHTTTSTAATAGMPTLENCNDCHEDIDKKKAPELGIANLFENGVFKAARVTAIPAEVIFSHQKHTVDHKVACNECHKGIPENTAITKEQRISMKDCIACHATTAKTATTRRESDGCATCHTTIREGTRPVTHEQNWIRFHGQKAKDGDQTGLNQCSLCHTESSCNNCHNTQAPANHTHYWRERGHGATASLDRDACTTCHKSDTCESCHKTTAPRSHRGQWAGPKDKHCLSCHFPLQGETCAVCHQQGTPSHAKASPKPAWHTAGSNCRSCHGIAPAAKLPHVDNGSDCNYCHK